MFATYIERTAWPLPVENAITQSADVLSNIIHFVSTVAVVVTIVRVVARVDGVTRVTYIAGVTITRERA